jgi:hypothetical protein
VENNHSVEGPQKVQVDPRVATVSFCNLLVIYCYPCLRLVGDVSDRYYQKSQTLLMSIPRATTTPNHPTWLDPNSPYSTRYNSIPSTRAVSIRVQDTDPLLVDTPFTQICTRLNETADPGSSHDCRLKERPQRMLTSYLELELCTLGM